jgi:tetratricopeptide (TPR) repeat protein
MDEDDLKKRKLFLFQTEAYIDLKEYETVLDLAQSRLKRIPGDLDARIVICRVRLLQGRPDEVRDMLLEMDEILAALSRIYACMGDIYMEKGMKDSAEIFYRKFKALNPGAPPAPDISERVRGIEDLHETGMETDADGEAEGDVQIPADFQTVTLAELYIRQGHLRMAEEVLEKIVGQDLQNETASGLLREVREQILREASAQQYAGVVTELSRWMDNIGRLRGHAA